MGIASSPRQGGPSLPTPVSPRQLRLCVACPWRCLHTNQMRLLACQAALATCIVQLLLTLQHCRMGVATTAAGQRFNYSQLHSSTRAQPQLVAKSLAKTVTHPFTPLVAPVQGRLSMLVKQKLVKIYTIIFQKSSKRFSNIIRNRFEIMFS